MRPCIRPAFKLELVTPTGRRDRENSGQTIRFVPGDEVEKIGYGAGTRDFAGHANVVRLTIGEAESRIRQPTPRRRSSCWKPISTT